MDKELSAPGFYKRDQDDLLYATMVTGPDYFLLDTDRDQLDLPIEGWTWYEDETSARAALGLPPVDESQT